MDVSVALITHHFPSLLVGMGIEPGVFLTQFCQSKFVSISITIIIVIICHCFSFVISFSIVLLERILQGKAVTFYGTGISYYLLLLCILYSQGPYLFSVMGREVGGGFMFGNACTPVVDSCQCMAKPIQYCKVK